jgi:hypothetical protein
MGEQDAERRRAPRYPVSAAVELAVTHGFTRDLSATGAFIETDRPLAPGTRIVFTMVFEDVTDGHRRARCEGEVVRVERRGDRSGVGVRITAHRWVPDE